MTWEDISKTPWTLDSKGNIEEAGKGYELAAIRTGYKHGLISWGWGCEHKIILFSSGLGGNQLNPRTVEQVQEALRIGEVVVAALNASEGRT